MVGFVAMYLAVFALALVLVTSYGIPRGVLHYSVGEVIPGSASQGLLLAGDRIDAIDGEPLTVTAGPHLVDVVKAKAGAPLELKVLRDNPRHLVRTTSPSRQRRRDVAARYQARWR